MPLEDKHLQASWMVLNAMPLRNIDIQNCKAEELYAIPLHHFGLLYNYNFNIIDLVLV